MAIRRRKIELLVEEFWLPTRLEQPPVPVERIAKAKGARIYYQSLEDNVSGFFTATLPKQSSASTLTTLRFVRISRWHTNSGIFCFTTRNNSMSIVNFASDCGMMSPVRGRMMPSGKLICSQLRC